MFEVNNKNIRTTPLPSFWCFYFNFEHISRFPIVSIADSEQVNVSGVAASKKKLTKLS